MAYLLGIDVGTSACKTALFDENGEVVADATEGYPVCYPRTGWAEQDPEEWFGAVARGVRAVVERSKISPREIAGIGVDGQSWSAVALDRDGNLLGKTPIWQDTRSAKLCREAEERIGEERILGLCGNKLSPTYSTGKLLWYREELPGLWAKTATILQSNGYIVYRLTGALSQDPSQCYAFHHYDMRKGCFDLEMGRELGIPEGMIPPVSPCHAVVGRVNAEAAEICGLTEGIPVVAGGLDAACASLGAGVVKPGQTQEQGGQSGGMSICTDRFCASSSLIFTRHVVPDLFLLQGGTTGGGGVVRWLCREFGQHEKDLEAAGGMSVMRQFDELAGQVSAGSDGVVFLPYMAGERTPIWDENAKGVYFGLDFAKTRGHLIRAALEGVAFSLRHNLESASEAGAEVGLMMATGGAANSALWTQMKADITGKEISVPGSDNATNLGAAILAGVGVGVYRDFDEAVARTVKEKKRYFPHPSEGYEKAYRTYRKLYPALKELMKP